MAISDEIARLQQAKADLKTAIEGKGVTVPSNTKLDGYADLVDSIKTGGGGGSSSSDGWAYYYASSCYVDSMLQVYKHITISNVTLEVYYYGEVGPTGWITNNPHGAPTGNSSYIPVYFRAKATSSNGGYFQFQTGGNGLRIYVKSFQEFGDIDTSINYINSIVNISGGAND